MSRTAYLSLPDGARLAYELLGSDWRGKQEPIVLVGGIGTTRGDWQRLAEPLALRRPVLVYDHRGIGESTTAKDEKKLSIELMARDLLFLLQSLEFSEIAICGFSMGGTVTQQLLLLPYLTSNPVALPFKVTHVLLTGTFHSMWEEEGYGLKMDTKPVTGPLTDEEKKARARPSLEGSFDPEWVTNNPDRLNWWLDRVIVGRPLRTILNQSRAVGRMKLYGYKNIPRYTQVLIIHGEKDAVVPYSSGRKFAQVLPRAKFVETGIEPGQVPNLAFGHHWWEYFDIEVWVNVVEEFLSSKEPKPPYLGRL